MSTWHRAKSATVNIRAVSESYTTQKFPKQVSQQHQLFFRRDTLSHALRILRIRPRRGRGPFMKEQIYYSFESKCELLIGPLLVGWPMAPTGEKKTSMICLVDPPREQHFDVVSVHCQETSRFIAGIFNSQLKCSFGCVPICWHTSPVL